MKKLPFIICANDGMLEARDNGTKYNYTIFQLDELCRAVVYPWEPTEEELCVGDLYECLDACNRHYMEALMHQKLEPIRDANCLKNGLMMPYVPLLVTNTVDGQKGGGR